MSKKATEIKRSVESGFNFSKLYFSKPTSVVLVTTYLTILALVLATLGFSKLIVKNNPDDSIPSLPDNETFAFLPADNIEIPTLGGTEGQTENQTEKTPEQPKNNDAPTEQAKNTETYSAPATVVKPVIVEKEVERTVEKTVEVPKEVVRTVKREVVKEIPATNQNYFDNYSAPSDIPYTPERTYENFPDIEETPKEAPEEEPVSPETPEEEPVSPEAPEEE